MPIISVTKDPQALTLTVVSEYPVPVKQVWDAYADPRRIEKFWGPVEWPATFLRHDLAVGGRSHYYMSGPDGERSDGYWEFLAVTPGRFFEVTDGFGDEQGNPNTQMPSMRMAFSFDPIDGGTRVTNVTYFNSEEELTQLVQMGMEEGMRSAMSQIDAVVADLTEFAAGRGTQAQILSDTHVRITRVIRGTVEQVWRAHTDATLVQRWLLGPEGWTMPVCELATEVGGSFRYEWEATDGSGRFGFEGELLEEAKPYRQVTTERMIGMEGPSTINELTFTAVEGGTLLSLIITYPDAATRDMILDTGMTDGMETSYARLESVLG